MADIRVTFTNNYGESRHFQIWDLGRDPNEPPEVFNGYLDEDQSTGELELHGDGSYGRVMYKRSDGAATTLDVTDGNNVDMD